MDIKDLNKSQLILLALLISFVTSIATGIATVSLMAQMPAPVTQTINRVVQQTIEKVVPDAGPKTQTVVVKEQDLVVDAISKNTGSIVVIKSAGEEVGRGFLVSKEGLILTDAQFASAAGDYTITYNATDIKADFLAVDPAGFSILKAELPAGSDSSITSLPFSALGDSSDLKAGQVAIALSSDSAVSQGIITGTTDEKVVITPAIAAGDVGGPADEVSEAVKLIDTSSDLTEKFAGGPILDIDGNVIGIVLDQSGSTIIAPVNIAKDAIMNLSPKTP